MKLADQVAVVTGAASGIGRATALALARRGCHLALTDVDGAALSQTAEAVHAIAGVTVSEHKFDVTDRAAVAGLPADVIAVHGSVGLLINNAGIAAGGTFEQMSEAVFDLVMDVNFHSMVRMTRAFLPHLRARKTEARIVCMSSVLGLVAVPGQTAYSASKFAVRGFSNALRHELDGSNVAVTVVHPGGVKTAIARSARIPSGVAADEAALAQTRFERVLKMAPEQAAEVIVAGIEAGRARIIVGRDAKIMSIIERLMPVGYWQVMHRQVR